MDVVRTGALLAAALTTGLMAGVFFAFTTSVMPGLGRTDDRTFVEAMQRINVAILNPWFLVGFVGAMVFTVLAAALHVPGEARAVLPWAIAAVVLYGATFVITGRINVPLNETLVRAGDPGGIPDLAALRQAFETPWVRWNVVRTLTSTGAFGSLLWALVVRGSVAL
jgi:uncharacterized membrane protein